MKARYVGNLCGKTDLNVLTEVVGLRATMRKTSSLIKITNNLINTFYSFMHFPHGNYFIALSML